MTRLCASPKLAGLDRRLTSRNSEIGRRLAKRVVKEVLRKLLRRSPKREVIASIGIETILNEEGVEKGRREEEQNKKAWEMGQVTKVMGIVERGKREAGNNTETRQSLIPFLAFSPFVF